MIEHTVGSGKITGHSSLVTRPIFLIEQGLGKIVSGCGWNELFSGDFNDRMDIYSV